jgi:hypothetical protein
MEKEEAFEKIMKAADRYASWKQDIANAHDRGTTEDWFEAQRMTKESRWELEQIIKAALFAVTKKEVSGE